MMHLDAALHQKSRGISGPQTTNSCRCTNANQDVLPPMHYRELNTLPSKSSVTDIKQKCESESNGNQNEGEKS
jgi:hypothetical protein